MQSASLGDWVRRRRRTLDLTQADLAAEVGCAPITIRKIEADERRPSRLMAERIAVALGLEGDDLDRFVQTARALRSPTRLPAPAAAATFAPSGALPCPPNALIGRTAQLDSVIDRLRVSGGPARLLTVTGPPGVGKTRFAVEVAARVERKFDVPAVFVDLTVAPSADDVAAVIAAAVATPTASTADITTLTVAALRRTPALLVVDNVEHVIDAAGLLGHLVEQCPELVCLATSRRPLDLYGEHVHPLGPFDLDDPDDAAAAIGLFAERAKATGVALPDDAEVVMAELCRALDGLPLALELAALRVRSRRLEDILEDLRGWSSVLRSTTRDRDERGRSASGAVRWSFEQLSEPAQEALVHAAAFSGHFTAPSLAGLMVAVQPDTIVGRDALDELADAALVVADGPGAFRLLSVVRAFGRDELVASGRDPMVRSAHAELVAQAVEGVSTGIDAWPERATLEQLARWDPEARAALTWCFDGGTGAVGRRILGAAIAGWHFAGNAADAMRWAAVALESAVADSAPDRYRYEYYLAVARWAGGEPGARVLMRAAVAGAEAADDVTWIAEALGMEQLLALAEGDLAGADEMTVACIERANRAGGEWQLLAQLRATTLAVIHGRLDEARAHLTAASALLGEHPSSWGQGTTFGVEGNVLLAEGRARAAIDRYLTAAEVFSDAGAVVYAIAQVAGVANACTALGEERVGARLYGLIDAWNGELGTPLLPMAQFPTAVHQEAGRTVLGPGFDVAHDEGMTLPRSLAAVADEVASLPASAR